MKMCVLLVEDEPDISLIARAALIRSGFDVQTADNGADALTIAAGGWPDVILLDCMLPGMDGFETCARLKSNASTERIPVVFLTAKTRDADVARCLSLGALGTIAKPFNPLLLGEQLRTLLMPASGSTATPRG